jgi:hypothetical protein
VDLLLPHLLVSYTLAFALPFASLAFALPFASHFLAAYAAIQTNAKGATVQFANATGAKGQQLSW